MDFPLNQRDLEDMMILTGFSSMSPGEFAEYILKHPDDYSAGRYFMELLDDNDRNDEIIKALYERGV